MGSIWWRSSDLHAASTSRVLGQRAIGFSGTWEDLTPGAPTFILLLLEALATVSDEVFLPLSWQASYLLRGGFLHGKFIYL